MSSNPCVYEGYFGYILKSLPLSYGSEYNRKAILLKKSLDIYFLLGDKWIKQATPSDFIFITDVTFKIYSVSSPTGSRDHSRDYSDGKCSSGNCFLLPKSVIYRDLMDYQYYLVNRYGRALNDVEPVSGEMRDELRGAIPLPSFIPGINTPITSGKYYIKGNVHIPKDAIVNISNCTILFRDITLTSSVPTNLILDPGSQFTAKNVVFKSSSILRNRVGGIIVNSVSNNLTVCKMDTCHFIRLGQVSNSGLVIYHPINITGTLSIIPPYPFPDIQPDISIIGSIFYGDNQSPYISMRSCVLDLTSVTMDLPQSASYGCLIDISGSILMINGCNLDGRTTTNGGIFNIPFLTRSFILLKNKISVQGTLYQISSPSTVIHQYVPSLNLNTTVTSATPRITIDESTIISDPSTQYIQINIS